MTFTIPNVPTDNLYKFIAISGLLLNLLSVTLMLTTAENYEAKLYEAAVQEIHVEDVLEDLKSGMKSGEESVTELRKDFDYYQEQYKLLTERNAAALQTTPSQKMTILKMGFWFGTFYSVLGFILWYFNVQRFHDEILKAKAAAELRTLSRSKNSLEN